MNVFNRCPSCGGIVEGDECKYCGTIISRQKLPLDKVLDFVAKDRDKRLEYKKEIITTRERASRGRLIISIALFILLLGIAIVFSIVEGV